MSCCTRLRGACPSPKRCLGRWQALRAEVTSLRTAIAPWSHIAGRVVLNQGSVGGLRNQTEQRCHGRHQARIVAPRLHPGITQEVAPNESQKSAQVTCVRSASLRRVVCGAWAVVANGKGLITQGSLFKSSPRSHERRGVSPFHLSRLHSGVSLNCADCAAT